MRDRLHRFRPFSRVKRWERRNNPPQKRASLEKKTNDEEGGGLVVKGISKRVIVVKSPDPRIFEQAIFIIREDFAGQSGLSEKDILLEAKRAANGYLQVTGKSRTGLFHRLRGPMYAAAGAAATAIAWLTIHFATL